MTRPTLGSLPGFEDSHMYGMWCRDPLFSSDPRLWIPPASFVVTCTPRIVREVADGLISSLAHAYTEDLLSRRPAPSLAEVIQLPRGAR